ncbi:O-methyltransferase family protein [Talaromyces proteolyticus]|uniref:O-methyltransferase family protein n=1 Tax=Talaromyces proteolyticus TaxID=1131652 RepID=A0AAD4KX12_9EURO|nr:O-methyltransferase family protein [Talaromyces proteolyticus]KAH8701043.1 O-methyltransferase family protein [Talaromyces proteolyticus]
MENIAQLKTYSSELATAVSSLVDCSESVTIQQPQNSGRQETPLASEEVHRAKSNILSMTSKIKSLVWGPTDFLQHLASQSEILACLRWLGEFQILACIPLVGSVPIEDIADLTGASETHLGRIIRLTATAGFLHEPQPAYVAHTPLSASFFSNPSLLDAAMFLSESAAPATLQMAQANHSRQPSENVYSNLTLPTIKSFHAVRERRPKLNRQWSAYLHHIGGLHTANDTADILTQLNWTKISNVPDASIVEVNVQSLSSSISQCLADRYPALHFSVQISDPVASTGGDRDSITVDDFDPRISVTHRALGTRQTATDAAVYILHLPLSSPSAVLAELAAHLDVLRARSSIMLILTARLLPEPGSLADPEVEAMARSRGLVLLQLANEVEMEMAELLEMIDTVRDSMGKLVVTKRLCSRNNLVSALVVKYQPGLTRP